MIIDNIKKNREKLGWSQQKLAAEASLSYNAITKIEQGAAKNPRMETLIKIADAFRITLDELVGR